MSKQKKKKKKKFNKLISQVEMKNVSLKIMDIREHFL